MDFFERQSAARRGSLVLGAGFALAMAGTGLCVHLSVAALSWLLGETPSITEPGLPARVLIALVWLAVLLGAVFRWLDVRAGAEALADRFGATALDESGASASERTLRQVVAEMAIAAGTAVPEIRLLAREPSINAFVVGGGRGGRTVLVVTGGAIERLDRDELQALVAHETAHIAHGDLPLNMRLLIALGGLAALDEIGRMLIGTPSGAVPDERVPNRLGAALVRARAHPAALVGWLLRALGSVGTFSGGLLRAALSRRRELLADAAAAQFTRQPSALASVLATIRDDGEARALRSPYLPELAHLCFHDGAVRRGYRRLTASHPPLASRIAALDPHIDVKRRKRRAASAADAEVGAADGARGSGRVESPSLVGGERAASAVAAADTVVSDRLVLMLGDPTSCLAALLALFAGGDGLRRRDFLGTISFAFEAPLADRVETLLAEIAGELEGDRLGIVERAAAVLRESVRVENRREFLLRLERLLRARGELDLAGYATLQLVRRRLDVEFPLLRTLAADGEAADGVAGERRVKPFAEMGDELGLLLSLLIEASGAADAMLERDYERVMRAYTSSPPPRRRGDEPGIVAELERAFQTLYAQSRFVREAFVAHCAEIVLADGRLAPSEHSLFGLFAAALDCTVERARHAA